MTLAVDFDGVIHTYGLGWHDGTIYDPPMPGAIEGLRALLDVHAVFIHTARDPEQVGPWLEQHGFDVTIDEESCERCHGQFTHEVPCRACKGSGLLTFWGERGRLLVTNRKLPAAAYLDDRAVRFHNWEQALTAMGVNPRLLDCGYCYEEWGEEVHPHPECPKGQRRARVDGRTHLDREQLIEQAKLDPTVPCCVCGGGPVVYDNYKRDLFCWRCADCDCGRDVCLRTGLHRPADGMCTATWKHPHRGLIPCDQDAEHYTSDYCVHQGRTPDGSPMQWRDGDTGATPHRPNTSRSDEMAEATTSPDTVRTTLDKGPATGGTVRTSAAIDETGCDLTIPDSTPAGKEDHGGPAAPGIPRCTATWDTRFNGIVTCWRAAAHNTCDGYEIHVGETKTGHRYQWGDNGPGTTPHRPCTATYLEPFHGLARCEVHSINPTGLVHEGRSEDGRWLGWRDGDRGATSHTDTVRTPCPDTDAAPRTPVAPDTDTPTATSQDNVRTARPDTSTDNPDGVRLVYTARVPRAQMGAAWAEGLGHLHNLLAEREEKTIREALHNLLAQRQAESAGQPAQDTPTDEDLTLGPDGLSDTERERKTIRDTLNTELANDEPDAVWALTLAISRALRAMPRHSTGRPGDELVQPTTIAQVTGLDQVDENPRELVHLVHGTVPLHEHLAGVERSTQEIGTLRARVGELAATLAETIGHFTIPTNLNGAVLRTGHVPAATVERWRRVHTGNGPTSWMFPPVQGNCPACGRTSLFLGSGGYVTCAHITCTQPEAATDALQPDADQCPRPDCTDTREQARRASVLYDSLRSDLISAAAYINQQRRLNLHAKKRHGRARILEGLCYWIKDPGPITPIAIPVASYDDSPTGASSTARR